jgi:hypothetical protein
MRYMKAADVLPPDLLAQVQAYIDGEYLYIPRRETSRKPWGAANGRKAHGRAEGGDPGPKSGDLSALSGGDLCGPAGGSLLSGAEEHLEDHRPPEK